MSESNVSRRQFNQLATAAFGGLVFGTTAVQSQERKRKKSACYSRNRIPVADSILARRRMRPRRIPVRAWETAPRPRLTSARA